MFRRQCVIILALTTPTSRTGSLSTSAKSRAVRGRDLATTILLSPTSDNPAVRSSKQNARQRLRDKVSARMREIRARLCGVALFVLLSFFVTLEAADSNRAGGKLLIGKAAMGDGTSDAPGVSRKITVDDLPPPSSNILAINPPRVVPRPGGAELHVPSGFKIDMYATGFREPRFLLTAPGGDIFVTESRANQIKVLRDTKNAGKPDVTEIFADHDLNKPFGTAFYPPDDDPQFLYVAHTVGVICFP